MFIENNSLKKKNFQANSFQLYIETETLQAFFEKYLRTKRDQRAHSHTRLMSERSRNSASLAI
jgi:hypothetical protein